jgi:hypothetical protein
MDQLFKVALMLLTGRQSSQGLGARITAGALWSGLAAVMMMAGVACILTALWIYLIPRIGPAGAALTVGGILLLLSGILVLVARSSFTPDESEADMPALGEELLEELREGFEEHKGLALLAALAAGLLVGKSKR